MSERIEAAVSRRCCDVGRGDQNLAYWELYIALGGAVAEWPTHKWPISSRHEIPTVQERTQALARLGYQPAPDAQWQWDEAETPAYHGHPTRVSMLGTIHIVPTDGGAA